MIIWYEMQKGVACMSHGYIPHLLMHLYLHQNTSYWNFLKLFKFIYLRQLLESMITDCMIKFFCHFHSSTRSKLYQSFVNETNDKIQYHNHFVYLIKFIKRYQHDQCTNIILDYAIVQVSLSIDENVRIGKF